MPRSAQKMALAVLIFSEGFVKYNQEVRRHSDKLAYLIDEPRKVESEFKHSKSLIYDP